MSLRDLRCSGPAASSTSDASTDAGTGPGAVCAVAQSLTPIPRATAATVQLGSGFLNTSATCPSQKPIRDSQRKDYAKPACSFGLVGTSKAMTVSKTSRFGSFG